MSDAVLIDIKDGIALITLPTYMSGNAAQEVICRHNHGGRNQHAPIPVKGQERQSAEDDCLQTPQ